MHEREGRREPLVGQVWEERGQLTGREHPLVHDRPRRQRREVRVERVLGPLAQAQREAVQRHPGGTVGCRDEELLEPRHDAERARAEPGGIDRHGAPAEDEQPLLVRERLDRLHRIRSSLTLVGQEHDPCRVRAGRRQLERHDRTQERVGDLQQDPRPVAAVRLGTRRAAVVEVGQRDERLLDDVVRGRTGQPGEQGDPAGVPLERGVVEALGGGQGGVPCVHVSAPVVSLPRLAT